MAVAFQGRAELSVGESQRGLCRQAWEQQVLVLEDGFHPQEPARLVIAEDDTNKLEVDKR